MKTKNDPRHQSRIIALQKLFEQEFPSNTPFAITDLHSINTEDDISVPVDEHFVINLVKGVIDHKKEIDEIVKNYTQKRPLEDTARVDLLIIRLSVYELLFSSGQVPTKVVIDEAVELAKEFGGSKSSTFVNGVLGSISRDNHGSNTNN